jgi:spectinomycin phosphotransferase/16S rRNA (guanine(1405)-N(7))-methyltransferase
VLTQPDGLADEALVGVLSDGWGLAVTAIDYRAVGFGSHHWEVIDADGVRWFVTVDDLDGKRQSVNEPEAAAFGRLRAALATAMDLRDSGAAFVVAPIPTLAGEPLVRMDRRFGVALYPYVDGQSYSWGAFPTPVHRRGVLDLIVALHTAPTAASRHAMADDFAVPHRDELELTSDHNGVRLQDGPYASLTSALLAENAERVRQLLARHDGLVKEIRGRPGRMVLTHGEPHPGNTMLTSAGWVLIDWDTVLLAPPERDLWSLDPGDGSVIGAYADATGTTPLPPTLELYRIRWDLADIAAYVSRFRGPHSGSLDDEQSWDELCSLIGRLPA